MTAIRINFGTAGWPFDLGPDDEAAAWSISVPPAAPADYSAFGADWTIDGSIAAGAVTNTETVETVGTIGAVAMGAPTAISTYKVDGTGIRIGILSDSFNLLD